MNEIVAVIAGCLIFAFLIALLERSTSHPDIPAGSTVTVKPVFRFIAGILALLLSIGLFFAVRFLCANILFSLEAFIESNRKRAEFWVEHGLSIPSPNDFPWVQAFEPYCVDKSAVTPAILVICTFVAMLKFGAVAISDKNGICVNKAFPFFQGYHVVLVQLGLLGTLFAFILVGGQMGELNNDTGSPGRQSSIGATNNDLDTENDTSPNSLDDGSTDFIFEVNPDASDPVGYSSSQIRETTGVLLTAFSTALVSTFVAVVFAFVLLPAVIRTSRVGMRYAVAIPPEQSNPDDSLDVLNRLFLTLNRTTENANRLTNVMASLAARLGTVKSEMDQFNKKAKEGRTELAELAREAGDASTKIGGLNEETTSTTSGLKDLRTALSGGRDALDAFTVASGEAKSTQDELASSGKDLAASFKGIEKTAKRVDPSLQQLHTTARKSERSFSDLHDTVTELADPESVRRLAEILSWLRQGILQASKDSTGAHNGRGFLSRLFSRDRFFSRK